MDRETQDRLDELGMDYFKETHKPFTNVFIDIRSIHDYHFSALYSMVRHEAEHEYIVAQIDSYNNRTGLSVAEHFPLLKFTDEQIHEQLIRNWESIARVPFTTELFDRLPPLFSDMFVHNTSPYVNYGQPIIVTFNHPTLKIPKAGQESLAAHMRSLYPAAVSNFVSVPTEQLPEQILNVTDIFIVHKLWELVAKGSIAAIQIFDNMTFLPKKVIADRILEPGITTVHGVTADDMFTDTAIVMNALCEFVYSPIGVSKAKEC